MTMKVQLNGIAYYLLKDALDSLNEGLFKYREGINGNKKAFKFSILHVARFIELICKYIIANVHPILIYKNAFSETYVKDQKTITFNEAINFIQNIHGEELDSASKTFSEDIKYLKNIRNKISHHFIHTDEAEDASNILGGIIETIYYILYHSEEKDIIINGINPENKEVFDNLVNTYKAKIAVALEQVDILNEGELIYYCPVCGNKTFILNNTKFKCTFCDEEEKAYKCTLGWCCGEALIPESEAIAWNSEYDDYVCEYCYDAFNHKANSD